MSGPIKFRIRGSDALDDAPPANDFQRQIADFLEVLRGIEEALAGEGGTAIEWRITNASRNSPLEIECTPYPIQFGVAIDERAYAVESALSIGLRQIAVGGGRPPYFTEDALERVERMAKRVMNGLAQTEIIFEPGLPAFSLTDATARQAANAIRAILDPAESPYDEMGSVEGYYARLERDGFGRGIVWVKHRVTGDEIKCVLTDAALDEVNEQRAGEVLMGRRVLVSGTISYRGLGRVREVRANNVRLLRTSAELPTLSEIQDANFTRGLISEEYLARLRDGRLT